MKKIVFLGIRHSGKSSTIHALAKAKNLKVVNEFWENETADIKKILPAGENIQIAACYSAYKAEEAFKKNIRKD